MDASSRYAASERPKWMQKRVVPVPGSSSSSSNALARRDNTACVHDRMTPQLPRRSLTHSGWGDLSPSSENSHRARNDFEDLCSLAPAACHTVDDVLKEEGRHLSERHQWARTRSTPVSAVSSLSGKTGETARQDRALQRSVGRRARGSGHRGAKCVSDLEALQKETIAEDAALIQQLTTAKEQSSGHSIAHRNKHGMPAIRKPAEDPPSLRAWRRNRQLEVACPGAASEEQKRQVSRMKKNLEDLVYEVRQLQDLMEDDVMEFAENVQTIRNELQAARARRSMHGTPATSAGPSMSNSAFSSVAPSEPSTPRTERSSLSAAEIRNAMLRASVESQRTATIASQIVDQPVALSMTPLPVSLVHSLGRRCNVGACKKEDCYAHGLVALTLFASRVVEFITGASALAISSICSATAFELHTRAGQRIWPHVEISALFLADDISPFSTSISWSSICSLSIFGATDATFSKLLNFLAPNPRARVVTSSEINIDVQSSLFSPMPCLSKVRFNCSSKGSKGAMQTRRRHGDHMGIGNHSFQELLVCTSADPWQKQIREIDVGWNHLDDGAMEHLRALWPLKLSTLSLQWNHIGSDGVVSLTSALTSTASVALKSIDLRSNPLGDKGVAELCRAVAERIGLTFLGIGETLLTDEGANHALPLLRGHPTLEALDIGENILTVASCEAIGGIITSVPMLHTLTLRGFLFEPIRINDAGGTILSRAVAMRDPIVLSRPFSIDLAYQQVACGTAAEMARCSSAWASISLFNTDVSTMGAMSLANSLRQQDIAARLKLNIAQCRIGEGAVKLLRNVKLARLDCHGQRGPIGV